MTKTRTLLVVSFLLLVVGRGGAVAQEQKRTLLYPESVAGKLQEVTAKMLNDQTEMTPCLRLGRQTDYFVRIAPRRFVIGGDKKLLDGAMLGGKPFVFVTTAESVYGLSLFDIYVGIGYEAEDILRTPPEEMVMIVFQYPKEIAASNVTNGLLPDDWDKKVYVPTWENMFSLFHRLSAVPGQMSQAERDFVLNFPAEAKQRITKTAYAELKAAGGADWRYRNLLEQKLSVFEHFRGNGRTQNEVRDPDGIEAGLIESVGPNWKVKELPEVAVISLGNLVLNDRYGGGCKLCQKPK
jgi:hypothetical protein